MIQARTAITASAATGHDGQGRLRRETGPRGRGVGRAAAAGCGAATPAAAAGAAGSEPSGMRAITRMLIAPTGVQIVAVGGLA
jgi:hypothetical protein